MFNFLRTAIPQNFLPPNIIRSYTGTTSSCQFVDGFAGLDYHKDKIVWYVTWDDANTLRIYGKVNNDAPKIHSQHIIYQAEDMASVFCDASYSADNIVASSGVKYEFKMAQEIYNLGREEALRQYAEYANRDAPKPPRSYR